MPFYEYKCDACGHEFEEFQKITDRPVKTCPECRKRRVRRLISQTSFVLKGSGWYVTDYARKGASASGGSGGKNGSGEKKAETRKDESKKTETKKDAPKTGTSSASAHH